MLVYTPRLSSRHSDIIRRISWAFNIPMTKVLKHMVKLSSTFIDKKTVCKNCKDKSFCSDCIFMNKPRTKLPGKKLLLKKNRYYFSKTNGK